MRENIFSVTYDGMISNVSAKSPEDAVRRLFPTLTAMSQGFCAQWEGQEFVVSYMSTHADDEPVQYHTIARVAYIKSRPGMWDVLFSRA